MDWNFAIERHRDALKRVLATLVAMTGLAAAGFSFPRELKGRAAKDPEEPAALTPGSLREAGPDEGCPALPRHLHRAVLRLLRPAEAAARRLVIIAARGLVVAPPRARPRQPQPAPPSGAVTGIWMPPHLRPQAQPAAAPHRLSLPLFDPLPRMRATRRKAAGLPRICTPGWSEPARLPPAPSSMGGPHDAVNAGRLALRLQALGRALDDLPREARRFARWRAARDAAGAQTEVRDAAGSTAPKRVCRVWPLKPGRPPSIGRRAGSGPRPVHQVHDILRDVHALAFEAMERFDSS